MRKQRLTQRTTNKLKLSPTYKLVIAGAGISIMLILGGLFAYFTFGTSEETKAAGAIATGYSNVETYTVDQNQVEGVAALTDFPVLLSITDASLRHRWLGGKMYSFSGQDMAFSNGDGTEQLYFDIQEYNLFTGRLLVWVKVPSLSATVNTDIIMYYGKSSSIGTNAYASGAWPSPNRAVVHMDEQSLLDVSLLSNDIQHTGTNSTTGVVDEAQDYDGVSDYSKINYNTSVAINSSFTISAWVNWENGSQKIGGLQTSSVISRGGSTDLNYEILLQGSTMVFNYMNGSGVAKKVTTPANIIKQNTWQHVSTVYDATAKKIYLYVNGTLAVTANETAGIKSTQTSDIYIAKKNTTGSNYPFQGQIDELNIAAVARPAAWLKTQYNSQASNSTFFTTGGGSLPIELLVFDAQLQDDNTVRLQWATEIEINNDHFTIERSNDAIVFEELGNIPGAGNSTVELAYEYTDGQPMGGTNYYRLKQTDHDGKTAYFDIVAVDVEGVTGPEGNELKIVSVGPNPFTSSFNAKFNINSAGNVRLTLTDLGGKVVEEASIEANEGENAYTFRDEKGLKPGIYILNVYDGSGKKPAMYKVVKG